jgi:ubiquinone biosynthesis accessory factor UbiJ
LSTSLPEPKATPAVAFCFFANHVLDGEGWARERLARFAGRTIELRAPLAPTLLVTITAQGRLEPGGAPPPAAEVTFAPKIRISGEAGLATELEELSHALRWDVEEDLSRVFGDVLAHRAVEAARALLGWQRDAAERLGDALGAYAADEARLVVRRPELAAFAAAAERLARALDALEQRVARLG